MGFMTPALQWIVATDYALEGEDSTTSQMAKTAMGKTGGDTSVINTVQKNITEENSVEAQSAQRRLARLSRYFTTPTGIMDSSTGSQGVF